jgi:hypothetical protein
MAEHATHDAESEQDQEGGRQTKPCPYRFESVPDHKLTTVSGILSPRE